MLNARDLFFMRLFIPNFAPMKVTLLQTDILWAQPEANLRHAGSLMGQAEESDLFVLPEMFPTGFATQPQDVAEPAAGAAFRWMQAQAASRQAAVAGSVAVESEGRYYNRFYFVLPTGDFYAYDKRHLFAYGGEHLRFTPGRERVMASWRGVKFLLQTCYDLRFPVFSRQVPHARYDVLLYVASWPESRRAAWTTLLQARAIENQCYAVGVNRVGDDPACHYGGASIAVDPYGRIMADCGQDTEAIASAQLDMARLAAFRKKFPVLDDADSFSIT